ncbi:hypothetical protein KR51_00015120 [Rubidibacter lacunae KORDI 51-2]|uniref:Uncharacterized protein n=1 Tax=Rubidibacter lacunae KORDI 51-2 TaxID=582515 RepID=U5DBC8_9CHRO|nr:hypothetical protein [Rubidibacter lacunae]ERN41848.1 hypothetical protein KR51_00015120 [Rubidibacter lacunae KORDI 51-2]
MTPATIHQLWSLVSDSQIQSLLSLDDATLAQRLVGQLAARRALPDPEAIAARDYIHSKLSLIRDLAADGGI